MRVIEIAKIIDSWMPTSIAEDFDNVGLIIGDPESKITSILVTLDTTEDVVEEAINKGCNLIVSYHPIIFNGLKQITNDSYVQKSVIKAVDIIKKNKRFGIFGDYDVDGASSSALLASYFKSINRPYEIYIPNRKSEGYGPSIQGFENLIKKDVGLIFTVDCGTLSYDPIKFSNKKGIDVIVLDHHQCEVQLPEAHSIINPNRLDDGSDLKYLCASGVTFLFLIALNKFLRENNFFTDIKEPDLLQLLDLVSLGTICDVVPLVGLNRVFVKQGLKILNKKNNLGIKTLIDVSKIENTTTTHHIGYQLGPRINAGGRVGKSSHGVNLLLNPSPKETFQLALELDQFNKERQIMEKELLKKVLIESESSLNDPILVLSGVNWHEGVIGIVASRLKDKFNKPTILISIKDGVGKASARSVFGFDIGSLILSALNEKIIIKGGGHKMAGGFTIEESKIEIFRNFSKKKFSKIKPDSSKIKKLVLDSEILGTAINIDFYDKIQILSPFGPGNPEPKFVINSVRTLNSKIIGENHIKSNLITEEGIMIKCIAFNSINTEISAYLTGNNKKSFNIAGKLSLNEWGGEKKVEFIIDDISVNKSSKNTVPSSIG